MALPRVIVAILSLIAMFAIAFAVDAQGISQLDQWRTEGGNVRLASSTAGLRIPSLVSCDTIDTGPTGILTCGTDGGGGGGSSGFSTTSADYWKTLFGDWVVVNGTLTPTTTRNVAINGTGTSTVASGLSVGRQIDFPYFYGTSTTASSTLNAGLSLGGSLKISVTGCDSLDTNSNGYVVCGTDATGAGSTFPYTPTTYAGVAANSTSTAIWLKALTPFSLIASSTFFTNSSSSLSSVGTVLQGTWNATAIGTQYGGTGLSNPGGLSASSLLQFNGSAGASALGVGVDGTVVQSTGGGTTFTVGAVQLGNTNAVSGDLAFANLAQVSANSLLGNNTSATADARSVATSTLFGASTAGFVLMWDGTKWAPNATATCTQITGSAALCDGDDAAGAGGSAFPYSPTTNYGQAVNATGTAIWFKAFPNSLMASSTARLSDIFAEGQLTLSTTSNTTGKILTIIDQGFSGRGLTLENNTNFAHNSLDFVKFSLLNTTDSSNVLNINNLGTGAAIIATSSRGTDFILNGLGNFGFASSSPSPLWGVSFGTTTIVSGAQFAINIASSTSQAATYTVNWETSNTQKFILNQSTNIVVNATSSNPKDGGMYRLKICQDSTGSRVATFVTPGQLRWTQGTTTIGTTAGTCTWIGMIYDATAAHYDVVASSTGLLRL